MNKLSRMFTLILLTGSATTALGQPMDRMMGKLDTDDDGMISAEEFHQPQDRSVMERTEAWMERMDVNNDGAVTMDELPPSQDEMDTQMHKLFSGVDTDGDGSVNEKEAQAAAFNLIDENGDGYLTKAELRDTKPPHGGAMGQSMDRMMEELDTDGDEMISAEEFHQLRDQSTVERTEAWMERIKRIDANSDGVVTMDEIQLGQTETSTRMHKFFDGVDGDGDGSMTGKEARAAAFGFIDKDGDGYLTKAELHNAKPSGRIMGRPTDQMMGKFDTDDDGMISAEEFNLLDQDRNIMEGLDTNSDGAVTMDEINHLIAPAQARMAERQAEMSARVHKFFSEADTDGDGSVTGKEAQAAAFNRIDKNGDGYLTHEELLGIKSPHDSR
ncbi:MAG: EF-hand domain-containing protein [Candidatus Azotimanducaceae bacterium WSBS_2022_MAG_OTU7]